MIRCASEALELSRNSKYIRFRRLLGKVENEIEKAARKGKNSVKIYYLNKKEEYIVEHLRIRGYECKFSKEIFYYVLEISWAKPRY